MRTVPGPRRQRGAVIVTAALFLFFLLAFMGIALDFGRLFITRSELQTAMDSCALAAAQELDGSATALVRARSAGSTARDRNRVHLQSAAWLAQIPGDDTDLQFRDANYAVTADATAARYAECAHRMTGLPLWLLNATGRFMAGPDRAPATASVAARAVATMAPAQTSCPIPVALRRAGSSPALTPGDWVAMLDEQKTFTGGTIGWANLDPDASANSAAETTKELNAPYCLTRIRQKVSTSGTQQSVAEAWNYRFGLYRTHSLPDFDAAPHMRPDLSGYSYTEANWPSRRNAYPDFLQRRASHQACAASISACESVLGIRLNGYQSIAPSGTGPGSHGAEGTNRRVVVVPVIDDTHTVTGFACMFMLQPHYWGGAPITIYMEYLGEANVRGSPCITNGLPGGLAGPLVPALVQ